MAISTGAALLGGAGISAVGQIIGGNQAADAQRDAANSSNALQRYIYDQNRADQAPYRNIGTQALQTLGSVYGFTPTAPAPVVLGSNPRAAALARDFRNRDEPGLRAPPPSQPVQQAAPAQSQPGNFEAFFNSPDYQFAFDQGLQALDRSAASRGRLYSGAQMQGAQRFGQGLASQQYGNWFNRLSGLAGIGQGATNQLGQYGQNYAANVGSNMLNAGNAQASSYTNRANALSGFIGDAAYGYGRGMFGGGGGGGPPSSNFGFTGYNGPMGP